MCYVVYHMLCHAGGMGKNHVFLDVKPHAVYNYTTAQVILLYTCLSLVVKSIIIGSGTGKGVVQIILFHAIL